MTSVRKHRVLVVDDSAFMRKLIAEMVASTNTFEVVAFARDGEDALAQLARHDPDIVTLDLEMPHLDGLQVLERMMRDGPRPVVVLSAGGEKFGDATIRALEAGAVDFVRKPSGEISLDLLDVRERFVEALEVASRSRLQPRVSAPSVQQRPPVAHVSGVAYSRRRVLHRRTARDRGDRASARARASSGSRDRAAHPAGVLALARGATPRDVARESDRGE